MRASEGHWRLPSSPIVGEKNKVFLCEFKSVLIYTWIAKPFILPLQFFAKITFNITFSQNCSENRKTAGEGRGEEGGRGRGGRAQGKI